MTMAPRRWLGACALVALAAAPVPAAAEAEACRPGASHRGRPIDLDLRSADVVDALRLVADAGAASIVVADDVTGTVTLRLRGVRWDLALCTIAAVRGLTVVVDRGVYLVRRT
ncbi:MAG: hypothetical protein R2939_22865 [Kofleriaceae bacterium]